MIRKTLGLTFASLSSAFLLLILCLPQTQAAANSGAVASHSINSAVYTKVTPVKTMALRDMRNLNQPPIMRRVMGDRTYTQQQAAQLRAKLIGAGLLKPAQGPFTIPLKTLKPFGGPRPTIAYPAAQHAIGHGLDFTSSFAFPGIGASDTPADPIGCAPPDTNSAVGFDSAVGSDVVVEIVNLCTASPGVGAFKVWNASTGAVIQGTTALGGLWSTSDCQNGGGDNNVTYDQFAHRWILSQFNSSYTGICIAISASDDPTGSYYLYNIVMDANGFTDYPKTGKWITGDDNTDAYYISANDFPPAACGNCVVYTAVQRSAMLTGSAAGVLTIIGPTYTTGLDFSALPADVDGTTTPPLDAPEYYVDYISPYYYGGSTYALEMWQMSVNWGALSASLTGPTQINVNSFEDGDYSCAPQPSPGECLPVLGDRLMYRLAYRNGYPGNSNQVLLVNHAVVDTSQGDSPIGIDWYELNAVSGSTNASDWGIAQQGLFVGPADGNSRFMGSISMDHVGNIALGYTISSTTVDASVAVAGQNVGAPSGVMDAAEQILIAGTGVQESTGRWGDYSSIMASSTDDCTFWAAEEYISNTGSFNWSTGNAAVKFSNCSIGPVGTLTGTVTDASTNNAIAGAKVTLTPGNISATTNSSGNYTMTVPVTTYAAAASAFGYLTQSVPSVVIVQNQTTTQDFALAAAPKATISGNVTDGTPSGHAYGLYSEVKVTSPGYGQVADVWTNPQTGTYSVSMPEGADYTLNATAYVNGYTPGSDTVTNLSGDTTQNIGLTVGTSCSAPGYGFVQGFGADFEGGVPPSGWTVTNGVSGSPVVWATNAFWNDLNYTNGTGIAATADSNNAGIYDGYYGNYDTALVTPLIPVSSLPADPILSYDASYIALGDTEDLDISTDGGTTWTNVTHWTTSHGTLYGLPGEHEQVDLGPYIPGGTVNIQLRWHYYDLSGGYTWYTQVDNVAIGACTALAGGMVEGNVTDQNTGSGLNGATVFDSNSPSNSVKTATNAADPNLPPAYYFLFSNTNSSDVITASSANYANGTATLNVSNDSVTVQNFALGAPQFNATPGFFHLHVMVNTNSNQYLTIDNTGSGAGNYSFETFDFPPPSGTQGHGAQLNQIHCTNLSPLSMKWLENQKTGGYDPGCGIGNDSFTKAPPNNPAWVAITDYPGGIMDNAVAADEGSGKIYSVGGVDGSGSTTAAGNVYDPGTQSWTAIAPMASPSEKPASAFINGKIYVADGWDASGNPTATLRIYDPSTNTWSTGANNPSPEGGGAGVAVLNNKMILIGGCPTGSSCGDTPVVSYDPATDSWTTLASYPHPISWESCGTVSGTLYCAGGIVTSEYADGYVYDASANTWSPIAPIPVQAGGLWASGYSGTSQGLLISGGISNGSITNIGFIYNPGSNSWATLPNSINSLYRGGSACGFYKVGGSLGGFIGEPGSELLAGYSPCGSSPIPWLGINPATGTIAAGDSAQIRFRFKGAGQTEYTKSHAYVLLQGTPYAPQLIDLKVHWDPQPIDLKVKVTPSLNNVYQGGIVVFHVKVKNRPLGSGYGPASGVTLTYTLPAGADLLNMTGPGTCSVTSGVATCTFGTLQQGEAQTEDFFVVPSVVGTMTSTFSDTANEPDIDLANNTMTVTTNVVGVAHVTLDTYTVNRGTPTVGEQVTFNLGVSNKGPDSATGVQVMAPLPANMSYVSSTASSGNCANKGGLVTCNIGVLTKGGKATVSITATVKSAGAITTMARVSAETKDPNLSNRTKTVSITVQSAGTGITRGGN